MSGAAALMQLLLILYQLTKLVEVTLQLEQSHKRALWINLIDAVYNNASSHEDHTTSALFVTN